VTDPYAPLKENRWQEIAAVDERLERGEIDEDGWHRAMAELIVPVYLAAQTAQGGSGHSGDWEAARRPLLAATDRDGTFLDVGCANGHLMESVAAWAEQRLEPYGLEIAPELGELARRRLPAWADRIFVGNVLDWEPPRRFTYVRTNLDYVPPRRRCELVRRLLGWAERVIVGVYNEERHARPTEELLRSCRLEPAGRMDVAHPAKPGIDYRVLWFDA
jgi:hypothetical protein